MPSQKKVISIIFIIFSLMVFCGCQQGPASQKTKESCDLENAVTQDISAPLNEKEKTKIGEIGMNDCFIKIKNVGKVLIMIIKLVGPLDEYGNALDMRFAVLKGRKVIRQNPFFKGQCIGRAGYRMTDKGKLVILPEIYLFKPPTKK